MKPILLSSALAAALSLSVAQADSHGSAEDLKAALEQSQAQIGTLNDSMQKLAAERDELYQALQDSQRQQTQAAESLKSLGAARNKLFSQLKAAQLDAAAERERLNATINNLAADRNKLFGDYRAEQSKASADAERMQDHILGLYDKRDSLQDQLAESQAQLDAAKARASSDAERMQEHILGLYDKRDSLEEQLAAARAETASNAESMNAKIAAGAEAQEGLIDQLIELRNSSDEKIASAEATIAELQSQSASGSAKVAELEAQLAASQETIANREELMDEMRGELIKLSRSSDERIATLEADLDDAQRQNRLLGNINTSTKNMMNSARSQLQAAKEEMAAVADSGGSAWAAGVADTLRGKVGSLAGTEVNTPGGDTVKVRVGNNGLFESGGIALSENGKQVLWVIGDALESIENARITIEGHTDSRPVSSTSRFANNWELSFARASSALAHLRTNVGIPPERLSVAGASDKFPIASNDSPAGREQNRRVEIVVTPMN